MQLIKVIFLVVLLLALSGQAWGLTGSNTPKGLINKPEERSAFGRVPGKDIRLGDPNCGSTVQDAVKNIGGVVASLKIPVGVHSIGADLTIPATLTLKLEQGAVLTRSGGAHLTINGPFQCGLWQCFNDNSPNHDWVIFGPGAVKEVDQRWWGAKGDGATDDGKAIIAAGKSLSNPTTRSRASMPDLLPTLIEQMAKTLPIGAAISTSA